MPLGRVLKNTRSLGLIISIFSLANAQILAPQIPQSIQALLEAHQYSQAEQALQREIEHTPGWDVGHLLLAQIYSVTGRYELAERSALSAVRLHESLDGFMLLALATQRLNRLNESIGWLEKAAQRKPDYSEIYKLLGLNYALGGMLKESEKAFRRSVELDAQNWELHYLLARCLYEGRELKSAQEELHTSIERNPSSVKSWTALGQVEEGLYDTTSAQESYRKALDLCGSQNAECAWPLLQMGLLTERQKGPREAVQFFRQAVAIRAEWAKPHFYLGKTLLALGNLSEARSEIEAAVRLDEGKSQYHYQLAQLYRRLKDAWKAKQHLARYQALAKLERQQKMSIELTE